MDNDSYVGFLALHSHPIVDRFAEIRDIANREALDVYYESKFYELYEREDTKLWHFSIVTLVDLLIQEVTKGRIEFPVEG